ncbi:MAG: methylated-DNA--[protein]-cysteine S-methyltransferase [Micrococcales bacterium]|nr:methylated-DNA--[protein]-cysteine S-methyltransferase [Micrococcales bacterium]
MSPSPIRVRDDELAALHSRLEAAAEAAGAVDIRYRVLDSPLGPLLLAATDAGLVRLAYAREGHDAVLDELGRRVSPRILRSPAPLDAAARELDEYFGRRRTAFDLPLDLRLVQGFRRRVLELLPGIAYGTTRSYARLADAAGSPGAVRAAGTACARNPLPIVVPCHRVVRTDGRIGQYLGGPDAKLALLHLEAAR